MSGFGLLKRFWGVILNVVIVKGFFSDWIGRCVFVLVFS